jgi:hypothetical protein
VEPGDGNSRQQRDQVLFTTMNLLARLQKCTEGNTKGKGCPSVHHHASVLFFTDDMMSAVWIRGKQTLCMSGCCDVTPFFVTVELLVGVACVHSGCCFFRT